MPTLRTIELSPATRADHLARLRAADADHPLDVLGWDAARRDAEVAAYRALVAARRRAEGLEDDAAAAAGLAVGFWARAVERSRGWVDDDVEALAAETRTAPDATPAGRTP